MPSYLLFHAIRWHSEWTAFKSGSQSICFLYALYGLFCCVYVVLFCILLHFIKYFIWAKSKKEYTINMVHLFFLSVDVISLEMIFGNKIMSLNFAFVWISQPASQPAKKKRTWKCFHAMFSLYWPYRVRSRKWYDVIIFSVAVSLCFRDEKKKI